LESIAKERLPKALRPSEVARGSGALGYVAADSLTDAQRQHAPSKATRMKVLNRDARRCFICGRSPMNHVDIELHVHHIVPWGNGGITEIENLVTLCGTCHDGLNPHLDFGLAWTVKEKHYAEPPDYFKGLRNYQQKIRHLLQKAP
jgi:predicted restriction endonuclease